MKTIGYYLKQVRLARKLTIAALSRKTHIKNEFLRALEAENWAALPEYPVVLGFIKSIAGFLDIDEQKTIALLRRDYPPEKVSKLAPKPDIKKEFAWSPKLTFFLGIFAIVLLIVGYLGVQYFQFTRPPQLDVTDPVENQVIVTRSYVVKGQTEKDASVKVNNQPVVVKEDGSFETEIELNETTKVIYVEAISRSGKKSEISRLIEVKFQ